MLWQWLKRKKVTINKVARRWKVNLKTANNHHFSRVTPISKKNIKSSFYSILVIIVNTSEKMLTLSLFFSDCSGKPISQGLLVILKMKFQSSIYLFEYLRQMLIDISKGDWREHHVLVPQWDMPRWLPRSINLLKLSPRSQIILPRPNNDWVW